MQYLNGEYSPFKCCIVFISIFPKFTKGAIYLHFNKPTSWKWLAIIVFVILAILSATFLSSHLSSPNFYPNTLQTLDDQKMDAMGLSVATTLASTALSILPDDVGSPIAAELADLSTPLFVIVCILYAEKFLLTTTGWISFSFLIPAACISAIIYICSEKERFFDWARKLFILGLALFMIIPASASITEKVEETFSESISMIFDKADQLAAAANSSNENTNAFFAFFNTVKDNVVSTIETAKDMLSIMVDAVAVLLITSCVIPLLTALVFVWVIKVVININIPVQTLALMVKPARKNRSLKKKTPIGAE